MNTLKLYTFLSRVLPLNYRMKIMLVAFIGTHVPLLALIVYSVLQSGADLATTLWTIGVALAATLIGTGITLFVLNGMLAPVLMTSRALGAYRARRELLTLPGGFTDEAGTLMADAGATLTQLEASLRQLETTDRITGLGNRDHFLHAIASKLGQGPLAVGIIRVRSYAAVRGAYDREDADGFMRVIAGRLQHAVGPDVELARLDGTDFAVALATETAEDRLLEIMALANAHVLVDGVTVAPELGGGISYAPEDAIDAIELVDHAVAAVQWAKSPKAVSFYSPAAHVEAREKFLLEQELRAATLGNQFELHYQPVVAAGERRVVGAEALVRWRHPERGLVPPGMFIPAAEKSGLIDDIGIWVLREACQQMARWQDEGRPQMSVAVNVSARQFLDPKLLDRLKGTISEFGIPADGLEIELTESAALVDYEHTKKTFAKLRDIGVSVAIDDFGTGYASMSYLRKLPFSKLKIDREFVSHVDGNESEQAICNAMIALARGLNLKVLAEGVERSEEVTYLAQRGCDLFQGYHFARPQPASELQEVISDIELRLAEMAVETRLSA